ncbi:hypothetical protein TrVE_jg8977 [Triparma verrucosa]|uniref:Right handed beta helix domain-containing protein n=1 Tax=Triparma verrucosa TaxID=1606542 RepID=A0A9W7BPF7_9STRA|nr:hypothetical protein TrVE_jg8977 [Triparma verrucosa]
MGLQNWRSLAVLIVTYACRCCATEDGCEETTSFLQGLLDDSSLSADRNALQANSGLTGSAARIPCGSYQTNKLFLRGGSAISSCVPADDVSTALILKACPGVSSQQNIITVEGGTSQRISGVVFDQTDLTDPSTRSSCAIFGGSGAIDLEISDNKFINVNTTSQGFSAIQLSGVDSARIHHNYVQQSGGDALNFNGGNYNVHDNTVENVGDGCIAFNNNARGIISSNILRRCNLGIGSGPAGNRNDDVLGDESPFLVTGNFIEDSDYGLNLGWFGYENRIAPINVIISNNVIRRSRSCGISYFASDTGGEGNLMISGNQIINSGHPKTQPPHTEGEGDGIGICIASVTSASITSNMITETKGPSINLSSGHDVNIVNNILTTEENMDNDGLSINGSNDIVVSGNTIRNYAGGIRLSDVKYLLARDNKISGGSSDEGAGGIVGKGLSNYAVERNTVTSESEENCYDVEEEEEGNIFEGNICWQ